MTGESTVACVVCPAGGTRVEIAAAVAGELRRAAVTAFRSFRHGGLETGGVLYGLRLGDSTRILSHAEAPCEHASGPAFALSERDQIAFASLLEPPKGLEAVGWYCSHTRRGLGLTGADRELFDRFFPNAGSLGVVLAPTDVASARGVIYSRDEQGRVRSEDSEFLLEPSAGAHDAEPLPEPRAAASRPRFRYWMAAPLLIAIAAVVFLFSRSDAGRSGLRAEAAADGQVRIEWNRNAPAVARAASAVLTIEDGGSQVSLPLYAEQLRTSSVTYAHQSREIVVRLRLETETGETALEESLRFVGAVARNMAEAEKEPEAEQAAAPVPMIEPAKMEAPVPEVRSQASPLEVAKGSSPPLPETVTTPRETVMPRRVAIIPERPLPAAGPVAILPPPQVAQPGGGAPAVSLPLSTRLPVLPRPKPAEASPRSGRIIWTGSLARRGVVEIDGSQASVGSIAGALPGVPVAVRVSMAEFTPQGLVVYTADAARHGRSESPGAANGWNATLYQWDPERVARIAVLESPNASNQYRRLALRSDARALSVIVIDWNSQ